MSRACVHVSMCAAHVRNSTPLQVNESRAEAAQLSRDKAALEEELTLLQALKPQARRLGGRALCFWSHVLVTLVPWRVGAIGSVLC